MKKKDLQALTNKDAKELMQQALEEKKQLISLQMDFMQNKLKNTRALFEKRKNIAKILTKMREKELAA